jgi:hypothetical protein
MSLTTRVTTMGRTATPDPAGITKGIDTGPKDYERQPEANSGP